MTFFGQIDLNCPLLKEFSVDRATIFHVSKFRDVSVNSYLWSKFFVSLRVCYFTKKPQKSAGLQPNLCWRCKLKLLLEFFMKVLLLSTFLTEKPFQKV